MTRSALNQSTIACRQGAAGPCLSGAIRLRSVFSSQLVTSHSHHLNHKLAIKFSTDFHSFPILKSAIVSLQVWYQLLGVCKSAIGGLALADQQIGDKLICYCRPGRSPLPSLGCVPSTWPPLRESLKNHQISSLSPGPSKIRQSVPKVTKSH